MIALYIIAYLVFCFSGWLATVKFFITPHVTRNCFDTGYYTEAGLNLSWCDCAAMAVLALVPIANISMNLFWLWVWRQHIKRRPLIRWPDFKFPKYRFPKCSIAIRGIKT